MMARKQRVVAYRCRLRQWLQWSRANDGAETDRVDSVPQGNGKLQWSRANDGAETLSLVTHCLPTSYGAVFERSKRRCQKQAVRSSERALFERKRSVFKELRAVPVISTPSDRSKLGVKQSESAAPDARLCRRRQYPEWGVRLPRFRLQRSGFDLRCRSSAFSVPR